MKSFTLLLALAFCTHAYAQFQYVSPMPGSTLIDPDHHIIIREGRSIDASSVNKNLFSITGSLSGAHSFKLVLSDDGKTILLYPDQPFAFSEQVVVSVASGLKTKTGETASGYSFSFSTHREYTPAELENFKNAKAILQEQDAQQWGMLNDRSEGPTGPLEREISGSFSIITNTNPSPGSVFYDAWNGNFFGSTKFDGYNIISNNGDSIFASDKATICFDFSLNPNGYLSVYNSDKGRFDILDSNFVVIDSYTPGNGRTSDPHEFTIYPDGHAFMVVEETNVVDMTVYNPSYSHNATLMTTLIQEFDASKNVIFEWRGFDHIVPTESNQNLGSSYIDVIHTNSIDLDADGNIVFSNRHLDQVNKIDRNTGEFIWRLGGVNNQFTFIGDDEAFRYQHCARVLADGHIMLWDNGNTHSPQHSSAKEYQLDLNNMTATLVWSFQPKTYSNTNAYFYAMGGAQRLSNGNTLVAGGWDNSSNQSNIWEVTPTGEVVWEMAFDNAKSLVGYRAHKYTWNPCAPVKSNSIKTKTVTSNSAKISWKASANATSYDVQYRKVGNTNWKLKTATTTNKTINNLTPNTSYEYQVRSHCANGFISDWSTTKTFTTLPQRNVIAESSVTALDVHPNPTSGLVNLDVMLQEDQNVDVSVYDLSGKVVYTSHETIAAGGQSLTLDLTALPSGVYFAEMKSSAESKVVKVIKQ